MSRPTTHFGTHHGRKLKASSFIAEVLNYPDGEPLEFTVRKAVIRKTDSQNRFLHVLFGIAAQKINEAGYGDGRPWTKDRVKAYAKQAGLYPTYEMSLPGGEAVTMCLDTHELSKEDCMETIDRVLRHFADEFGIYLPSPGEQVELEMPAD